MEKGSVYRVREASMEMSELCCNMSSDKISLESWLIGCYVAIVLAVTFFFTILLSNRGHHRRSACICKRMCVCVRVEAVR